MDLGGDIRLKQTEEKIRILKRNKKNEQKYRERNAQNIKLVQIVCDAISSIDIENNILIFTHTHIYIHGNGH